MERKHKFFTSIVIAGVAIFGTVLSTRGVHNSFIFPNSHATNDYILKLDSSNAFSKTGSGSQDIYTSFGHYAVQFSYTSCAPLSGGHVKINQNGTFANDQQITSVESIVADFSTSSSSTELQFRASYDKKTWGEWSSLASGREFSISSKPYYFEFKAVNGAVNLTSLTFAYSCKANPDADVQESEPVFTKMTSVDYDEDISGEYLIVSENNNVCFDGSKDATNLQATFNSYAVSINDNKTITYTEELGKRTFIVSKIDEDTDGYYEYTIKSKSGFYVYSTSNSSNGLFANSNAGSYYSEFWTNDGSEDIQIWAQSSARLRFNKGATEMRFRYFSSEQNASGTPKYENQETIQLYKLDGQAAPIPKPTYETGLVHTATKTTFNVQENFNSCLDNELTVQVRMSNGTLKTITKSDYQVKVLYNGSSEININSTFPHAGNYVVEISYAALMPIRYNINVANVTTSITATKTKTTYNIGDSISLSDISAVKNYYVDGSSSSISYANFASNDLGCTLTNPNSVTVSSGTFNVAGYWKAKVYLLSNPSVYSEILIEVAVVPVTGITLDKSTATVNIGETVTLTPTISPSNATDKTVIWTTSSSTYATVSNGVVTGKAEGQVTITAKAGNYSASCVVTVKSVKVTGVTMSPTSLSINIGETSTLSANISPSNATNKSVTWSSNNSCVTVNANGVIEGVSAGSATITVTTSDGGFTATCSVTCKAVAVTSITLSPESLSLFLGGSKASVSATVAPDNATDKTVTWTIDKPSIATISASGSTVEVTPVAAGTAILTATSGSISKTCAVTVNEKAAVSSYSFSFYNSEKLTSTTGTAVSTNYVIGKMSAEDTSIKDFSTILSSISKSGTVEYDKNGGLTVGASKSTGSITFNIKSGYEVIKVEMVGTEYDSGTLKLNDKNANSGSLNEKGSTLESCNNTMVWDNLDKLTSLTFATTAKRATIYTLVFYYGSSSGGGGGSTDVKVTGITVSPSSSTLDIGETVPLSASVTPTNATNKAVEWSSDDSSVASVSTSGVVTANGAGTCTITATAKDGSGVTGTASISVKQPAATLSSISISNQKTEYSIGESFVKPTVTAHYSDGTTANVTSNAEFSGFNSTSSGERTITVSYTEGSITKTVTYTINVKSSGGTVVTGDEYQITFKASGSDNSANLTSSTFGEQIETGFEYILSYSSMDKVFAGSEGIKFGNSSTGGHVDFNVSSTISNNEAVAIKIDVAKYGTVTGGTMNVYVNGGSEAIASVDPSVSDSVTGELPSGTMIQSIKISSSKRAYLKGITITTKPLVPVDPTSISVSPSTLAMSLNETSKLSVSYSPSNANQNKGITWSTSNKNVATVSSDGTVTAVAKGTATITATSTKGLTATCNVEVKEIAVSGITVSPTSATISNGSSKQLSATINPYNATNKDVSWKSSNTTVASVDSNGLVTAKSLGKATITATAAADSSKTATCTVEVVTPQEDAWTIMIYMCGADLESESALASGDIAEMLSVSGQSDKVNVIIQTGGASKWGDKNNNFGISGESNQRYHIENRKLVCDNKEVYKNTYKSMGQSSTFADFMTWGLTEYPAEKTGVILWNHGGAMRGVCYDELSGDDALLNSEVKSALSTAFNNVGRSTDDKLEWIGYDACLMQAQDIAEFNSKYFNYMIASQESEAGYGWDYDKWLGYVYNYSTYNTERILTRICDTFISDNGGVSSWNGDQTLSWLNLSYMPAYKTAFESFASALKTKFGNNVSKSDFYGFMHENVKYFGGDDEDDEYFGMFDVIDFLNNIQANTDYNPGGSYISNVKAAFNNLLGYSTVQRGAGNANGLCCIYSKTSGNWLLGNNYSTTQTNFTNWRSFVSTYGAI